MQRALKLQVMIGKDHVVKLPSEFPEGPAEIIVMSREAPDVAGSLDAMTIAAARRAALGRYDGLGFKIPDDFDAPLPADIQRYFEGDDDENSVP